MLRIMTYNIRDGGVGRERLVLKVLEEKQADIIILQEVYDSTPIESLARNLQMYYFLAPGNSRRHLALLSRYPIIEQDSYHPFPPISKTVLYAKVAHPAGWNIHAFGMHLFPHPFVAFELWRRWEIEIVLRKALQFDSELCFLAGDLNAVAPGDVPKIASWPNLLKIMILLQRGRLFHFATRAILAGCFTDCYREMNPRERGYTLPTRSPTTRLDYIFANRRLVEHLVSCDIVHGPPETDQASDHYPLLAEFSL